MLVFEIAVYKIACCSIHQVNELEISFKLCRPKNVRAPPPWGGGGGQHLE